ncbi:hypothetical protein AB6A40_004859 [Gnathostoma spinigerum]|uniref:Methyltransferase HEMK2 n=1 Tax=Gnathostoma spinigerum TaxID=75299 RepID=A0ABD6EPG7_9BILA
MVGLPTPLYHLSSSQTNAVYDPSEDSFLLLDALEKDADEIRKLQPLIVVEVGCGTGIASSFVAKMVNHLAYSFASDINPTAAECCRTTAAMNSVQIDVLCCDLLSPLQDRLAGFVDILLFNPPYVPTDEQPRNALDYSWSGGLYGRATLDRFLPHVPSLLSDNGSFYLVALKSNNVPYLLSHTPLLDGHIVLERRCGMEYLYVLKFVKKANSENVRKELSSDISD